MRFSKGKRPCSHRANIPPTGVAANVENVRCACETLVTTGSIIVSGEIRTQAYVDVQQIARNVVRRIGTTALSLVSIARPAASST